MNEGPPIVAFANQKGGVGKTTSTLAVAGAAARDGRRVLVIDVDPQRNATTVLLGDDEQTVGGVYPVARGDVTDPAGIAAAIQPANDAWNTGEMAAGGVDVMPGNMAMGNIELDPDLRQPLRLHRAFKNAPDVIGAYDLVLIDCPPNVGRNFTSAMVLATHVIFVAEPGLFSSQGLGAITESLQILEEAGIGTVPELLGVLVNRFDRTQETLFRYDEIKDQFGPVMFKAYIPTAVALKNAVSASVPIQVYVSRRGRELAMLYDSIWFEMTERLNRQPVAAQ